MTELIESALIEAGAIAIVVGIVIEAGKRITNEKTEKRFLPLFSLILGVLFGIGYALIQGDDVLLYAVSGLIGGGFASGVYDNVKSIKKGSE